MTSRSLERQWLVCRAIRLLAVVCAALERVDSRHLAELNLAFHLCHDAVS